jgi:hypothetical protein
LCCTTAPASWHFLFRCFLRLVSWQVCSVPALLSSQSRKLQALRPLSAALSAGVGHKPGGFWFCQVAYAFGRTLLGTSKSMQTCEVTCNTTLSGGTQNWRHTCSQLGLWWAANVSVCECSACTQSPLDLTQHHMLLLPASEA